MQNEARSQTLFRLANDLALATPDFFEKKGPGKGNYATNDFVFELSRKARETFGEDCSEKNICGRNSLAVDYYFPDEQTIVEIAFGLRNPNSEFEKDVLKAVMALDEGNRVSKLVFISKPGAQKKCEQPGRRAVIDWLRSAHGIQVSVHDLGAT